uniref:t-SNARE coiled-coil homology domain-containing protein n=1 Tax=Entomoneis paludosa TaxID=265537 RepID=A0A7S3DRB5_9STRA|mmetsp:Transcript_29918/g.62536  ORF Transcript_29918/g.62536 Transcript_29918/m.62536 type:complete len:135 (+) Transcript_29918:167-571(+)
MSTPMRQRNNGNMYGRRNNDIEGGPNRRGGGGLSSGEANAGILESQNNEYIDELSDQVARLKGLTIDIGNEVKEQNSLLDGMGDGFSNVGDMLSNSLGRIGTMLESTGTKHMLYMVTFCVVVICTLWWLMSSSK